MSTRYHIFAVCETWLKPDAIFNYDLPDFVHYVFSRQTLARNARRGSGGLIVYVRRDVAKYLSVESTKRSDDRVWFKFSIPGFDLPLYLGIWYIPPKDTTGVSNLFSKWNLLLEELCLFGDRGFVMLMGDFNARIGNTLSHRSHDKVINEYGKQLLDICDAYGLVSLNVNPKFADSGNFTCVTAQGASVVDYALISSDWLHTVNSFVVGDPLEISDHCTIEVTLKSESDHPLLLKKSLTLKQDILMRNESQLEKITPIFKWNNDSQDLLLEILKSGNWRCEELAHIRNEQSINRKVMGLQNLLLNAAIRVGAIVKYFPNKKRTKLNRNQPWFDLDCRDFKKKWKTAVKLWRQTSDNFTFVQMMTAKKEFKSECKRKKVLYSLRFQDRLQQLKKDDSKSFWKLIQGDTKENAKGISENIEMKDWFNHFSRLHDSIEVEVLQPEIT